MTARLLKRIERIERALARRREPKPKRAEDELKDELAEANRLLEKADELLDYLLSELTGSGSAGRSWARLTADDLDNRLAGRRSAREQAAHAIEEIERGRLRLAIAILQKPTCLRDEEYP